MLKGKGPKSGTRLNISFRKTERKSRPIKLRSGPGRYFVLTPKNKEIYWSHELSGPGGAKEFLDVHSDTLPNGTEVVRRRDGVVMSYLSKKSAVLL